MPVLILLEQAWFAAAGFAGAVIAVTGSSTAAEHLCLYFAANIDAAVIIVVVTIHIRYIRHSNASSLAVVIYCSITDL